MRIHSKEHNEQEEFVVHVAYRLDHRQHIDAKYGRSIT